MSGCTSQECVVAVGEVLGVQYMVVGSVDKLGRTYLADIRMVDVETGEVINAVNETCKKCGRKTQPCTACNGSGGSGGVFGGLTCSKCNNTGQQCPRCGGYWK